MDWNSIWGCTGHGPEDFCWCGGSFSLHKLTLLPDTRIAHADPHGTGIYEYTSSQKHIWVFQARISTVWYQCKPISTTEPPTMEHHHRHNVHSQGDSTLQHQHPRYITLSGCILRSRSLWLEWLATHYPHPSWYTFPTDHWAPSRPDIHLRCRSTNVAVLFTLNILAKQA